MRNAKIVKNSNGGYTEAMYHNVWCLVPTEDQPNPDNPFVQVITIEKKCSMVGDRIYVRKDCLSYVKKS